MEPMVLTLLVLGFAGTDAVNASVFVPNLTEDFWFDCGDATWYAHSVPSLIVKEAKGGGLCVTLFHNDTSCNGTVTGEYTDASGKIHKLVVVSGKEVQQRCLPPTSGPPTPASHTENDLHRSDTTATPDPGKGEINPAYIVLPIIGSFIVIVAVIVHLVIKRKKSRASRKDDYTKVTTNVPTQRTPSV